MAFTNESTVDTPNHYSVEHGVGVARGICQGQPGEGPGAGWPVADYIRLYFVENRIFAYVAIDSKWRTTYNCLT